MKVYSSIPAYITDQPKEKQAVLREMYKLVQSAAPAATEAIKYGMPAFVGKNDIVYFAAMKGHLGFYPTPSAITQFAAELSRFSTAKGCVRIPYGVPLPTSLITKMVKFRVKEDAAIQ
jgi:uncharacterized protein YdhG (YjbR/CyaY superfamily)